MFDGWMLSVKAADVSTLLSGNRAEMALRACLRVTLLDRSPAQMDRGRSAPSCGSTYISRSPDFLELL